MGLRSFLLFLLGTTSLVACSDDSPMNSEATGGLGGSVEGGSGGGTGGVGGSIEGGGTGGTGGSGQTGGTGGSGGTSETGGTGGTVGEICAPLPAPIGIVTQVDPSMTGQLQSMIANAQPNESFVFANGTYDLSSSYLWISTPGVSLRSASGQPEDVILDGNYGGSEIVTVAASDVTVAEITIQRAKTHPIHVVSTDGGDTVNTRIYRVRIIDPGQQAIKINPHGAKVYYPDDGQVACSWLLMTDAGRAQVSGCYTGGVDAHQARGWVIRDNYIEGFWCNTGLSEHAVHMWRGCRDTIVERNVLVDNARGVGFGLASSGEARTYSDDPCPAAAGSYVGHYGGIVRNNFIVGKRLELFASAAGFDSGISFWSACQATAVHNTIAATGDLFSGIEWRFPTSTGIQIINNLVTHSFRERDGASAARSGNMEDATLWSFVDVEAADLHLVPGAGAIGQGVTVEPNLCPDDIDGDARKDPPDVGADEHG